MSKLEMLTEAADLVESKTYEEGNGKAASHSNGIGAAKSNEKSTHNGTHESTSKSGVEQQLPSSNNYHDKGIRDDSKPFAGRTVERTPVPGNNLTQDSQRLHSYNLQRVGYTEGTNGTLPQARQEHIYRKGHEDNISPSRKSPDRFPANIQRRSTSPASDRGGDNHSTTKPMVLLQPSAATTLPSAGSAHATRISNPTGIPIPTMHHPYMYHPLLYQPPAGLDSVIANANSRAAGVLKESERLVSSPSRSTSEGLNAATAAGLHLSGLVYPLMNHPAALLMGARPPGAEMPPVVLGQPANPYPAALDQYKRMLEGLQFSQYSGLNPQFADQYLKSLAAAQGLDATSMIPRLPSGMPLAAPSGADLLRYPEHWPAAMSILRPPDRVSPRSGSPFAINRRTDSPIIPNGGKSTAASYPFHHALVQSQINHLTAGRNLSRSPATLLQQAPRSRSPPVESRKPEMERSGFRSHSRDHDREIKPAGRELTSASVTNNGRGRNSSSEQVPPYSVTDENGRKIPVPSFYGQPTHISYAGGLPPHPMTRERSPSPRPRDDRTYSRPQRDRSPIGAEPKRRSLEGHHLANDRHNSRPSSPLTNGLMQAARSKMSAINGNAEATVAAEISKHNPHLLFHPSHTRPPNPAGFNVDGREQRNSNTPPPNPYLVAGVQPFLNPHLLTGLANHPGAAHYMLSPQYAQALAAKSGIDLSALYKTGENADYARLAGLQLAGLQQQQLLAGARPPGLPQDYVAALKNPAYFPSQAPPKDGGKSSPANVREKLQVPATQMHSTMVGQAPPKAQSPPKVGLKPSRANDSPQMGKTAHHSRPETHSPTGNSNYPPSESRRHHQSPNVADRDRSSQQEVSPKQQQSSRPYRPNPMLRQHAPDLERSRKRKMMEEELANREDSNAFVRDKSRNERDYHSKDDRKDPKRVKHLISENDPEEHFRRSLGKDYKENKIDISCSVDEHFKKALGSRYEQLHAGGAKIETRDTNSSSSHHLPPYSVAVAAASQSNRMYSHPDVKEPPTRYYDQPFLTRERYYHQSSPHNNKKGDRSPPGSQSGGTTVLYPQNPAVVPARQKVKAKAAFIPEASSEPHKMARTGRPSSDGSKGSARSISGGSMENIPAAVAKSPPTTSPPALATSDQARPTVPPVISQGIPYTFAHQANAIGGHVEVPTSNNAVSQRIRNSPTSSSRNLDQEEQAKIHLSGSPTRSYSASASTNHRESTESMGKEGKGST